MFIPAGVAQQQRNHGSGSITDPTDISGCILWLDASNRGSTTNQWDDLSGNANHYTSPAAGNFPSFSGGVATFDGTSDYLTGPDISALTSGEIFIKLARYSDASETGTNTGFVQFGTAGNPDHYLYNGVLYTCFGTGGRINCGNPTPDVSNYLVFNAWSATNDWAVILDGTTMSSSGSNTVSFPATPYIGKAASHGYYFQGGIKSVVLFNKKLSTSERSQMDTYMAGI